MRSKFVLVLGLIILLCGVVFPINNVYAESGQVLQIQSSAKALCVVEQSSNRVLYGKNINQKLPMASTTKIFTAITVLENCNNLQEKVPVDDRAVGIEGTSIYLRKHEVLSVEELLLGMMLPSGNDAATALAYYFGKTLPGFCKMMNDTAQKYGAKNSSFKNPHGLDEDGHYTTAYDLAVVSANALKNPLFYEISTTKSAVISGNQEVKSRYLKNKNKLLKSYEGCCGVKTGFTDNAGRCFVSSAKQGDMTIVCSALNCPDMFEECARCMDLAFSEFSLVSIVEGYSPLNEISVENGRENSVKLFSRKEFYYPLSKAEKLKVCVVQNLPEKLMAPVEKEQVVGKLEVYLGGEMLFCDDVLARESVKKNSVFSFVQDIAKKMF